MMRQNGGQFESLGRTKVFVQIPFFRKSSLDDISIQLKNRMK